MQNKNEESALTDAIMIPLMTRIDGMIIITFLLLF